ncbi:MAG: AI-2E family transporter, partial [Clostridiales Family XIII bacterium]|nr:AI-2E family transporter [Clostridiales Family XIII bacterium]
DLLAGGETDFAAAALGVTKQVFSGLANAVIGLVFAIYILLLKDRLSGQTRAFIAAHFKEKTSLKIFRVTHLASRTFAGFVRGQFFEGVIVAVLVFIGMLIINASYAVMFAVLLGICAFIPVIGSIIGTIAAAVVLLAVNPWEALAFVIFIIVMQQIESNVIYPRVVGSIISLPGIWVLLAVVAGAAFSGIVGVVVCVPLIALIYSLVRDNVRDRLEEKGVSAEKIDELVAQSHEQIKIFEREPHNKE